MSSGIGEIVGIFLVAVGCGLVVGAAALISIPLAVLSAGLFVILGGSIAVYVANVVAARKPDVRP